jgi:hypothetical protein
MTSKDPDEFIDDTVAENKSEREADYSVTPEEGEQLRKKYATDATPDNYKKIKPEEFFDGA